MAGDPHRRDESIEDSIQALLYDRPGVEVAPDDVIIRLPIDPYHHVADIGCGPGYFSLPLAKYLSYGKLYAIDTDERMLEAVRERLVKARLSNVEVLKCEDTDFPLPEASVDGLFLAFVVHLVPNRSAFFEAAAALVKKTGWCAVLEFTPGETAHQAPPGHHVSPEEVLALAREAGLSLRRRRNIQTGQYLLLFEK